MLNKKNIWYIFPVILLIVSLVLYPKLPDDIPMQFNIHGEANWTLPKMFGLWIMPCMQMLLLLYDRKKENHSIGLVIVVLTIIQIFMMTTCL